MTARNYGNWVKPRSAGFYGMTFGTSAVVLGGIILFLIMAMTFGPSRAFPFLILEIIVILPLVLKLDDQTGYEKLMILGKFFSAKLAGEHTYRSGRFSRVPGGTYKLPGLLHRTDLYNVPSAGLGDFAMGHDKAKGFYTIWFRCFPSGAEAIEQEAVDFMVSQWGGFLTDAGNITDLVSIAVTHETRPESGIRLATEAERITADSEVALARDIILEAANSLPQVATRMESRVAVTFKATTAETRKDPQAEAIEIARFIPALMTRLKNAGINASLMTTSEVCGFVHSAYNPAAEQEIEQSVVRGEDHGYTWDNCGPSSAKENRTDYQHEDYRSVTFEMTHAPRGLVTEMSMAPIFSIDPELPRKRVTMIFRPHTPGDAAELADEDYRNSMFKARSNQGIGNVSDDMAAGAAGQTRREIAQGFGLCRFGLMITVTHNLDQPAEMARQESVAMQRARQCGLRVRRCNSWQAAAFAGALGAGIVLPEETSMSKFISG